MSASSSKFELFCILCSGNSKASASGFLFGPYLWVMVSVTLGNKSRKSKGEIIQGEEPIKEPAWFTGHLRVRGHPWPW